MADQNVAGARAKPAGAPRSRLNDPRVRAVIYQILMVAGVGLFFYFIISNTITNLDERKIKSGFDFLWKDEAGFAIGEHWIPYEPSDSYLKALIVGAINTIRVAILGIILSTVLGVVIGIARLSPNWLISRLASVYVETFRNIPILLQLFFWAALVLAILPSNESPGNPLPGLYFNKEGINFPIMLAQAIHIVPVIAFVIGIVGAIFYKRRADRIQAETGDRPKVLLPALGLIVGLPLIAWLATGAPFPIDSPTRNRFGNYEGGVTVSVEFLAILIGLSVYTSSFIAEIVRGGILAVSHGQTEAAMSLGLKRSWTMRLVILPQALRVIIPPQTSQYLNLTKNSSLAVAIGYPDLVSVTGTTLNQTGQAIECISVMMLVYLTLSLSTSVFMNWYNKRVALVER